MKLVLTTIALKVAALMILVLHIYAQHVLATTPFEGMPLTVAVVGLSYLAMPGVVVLLIVALVEIWKR